MKLPLSYSRYSSTILPSRQRAIVEKSTSNDLPVGSMTVPSGSSSGPVNVPVNGPTKAVYSPSPNRMS